MIRSIISVTTPALFEEHMGQVALGIVYRPDTCEVLMLRRSDLFGLPKWVFPGGKFEAKDGSRARSAAAREIEEETGLKVSAHRSLVICQRVHPATNKLIHYCLFTYRSTRALLENKEPSKHEAVEWIAVSDVLRELGSHMANPVADRLRLLVLPSSKPPRRISKRGVRRSSLFAHRTAIRRDVGRAII